MSIVDAFEALAARVDKLERRMGGTIVVDTPISYLPFVNYDSLGYNCSSNGYPYSATVPRRIVIIDWSIAAYVKTTNDGSNYWKIQLRKKDTTLLDELDTSAGSAGAWA